MTTIIVPRYRLLTNSINKAFAYLRKIAKDRKLYFSKIDEIGRKILAVDITKMQLLYADSLPGSSYLFVDLKNLQECRITKQYEGINAGELHKKKLSDFLKTISLNLRFPNGTSAVNLPLYDAQCNYYDDVEQMEVKAKKWTSLISKLIPQSK